MSDSPEQGSDRIDELRRVTHQLEETEEELRRQLGQDADLLLDLVDLDTEPVAGS